MARNYSTGVFEMAHPEKYAGKVPPRFRSSWERSLMVLCDRHPNVTQWAYEALRIPYLNPVTGRKAFYVPDFVIRYQDRRGRVRTEVVEVKPMREATLKEARSRTDRAKVLVNEAKWIAAREFCRGAGLQFRIITENEIFMNPSRRKR